MKQEIYFVTKRKYGTFQRKLAWFKRYKKDFYFNVFGFFKGEHTSYHESGGIFRTSPVYGKKPRKIGQYFPLEDFKGWHQLGTSMIQKSLLHNGPPLRKKDRKRAVHIEEIDLEDYPSDVINIVLEFLEPEKLHFLKTQKNESLANAKEIIIKAVQPWIILTMLGHKNNLLIEPNDDGFTARHYNSRYSTNRRGVDYRYEARGS